MKSSDVPASFCIIGELSSDDASFNSGIFMLVPQIISSRQVDQPILLIAKLKPVLLPLDGCFILRREGDKNLLDGIISSLRHNISQIP